MILFGLIVVSLLNLFLYEYNTFYSYLYLLVGAMLCLALLYTLLRYIVIKIEIILILNYRWKKPCMPLRSCLGKLNTTSLAILLTRHFLSDSFSFYLLVFLKRHNLYTISDRLFRYHQSSSTYRS